MLRAVKRTGSGLYGSRHGMSAWFCRGKRFSGAAYAATMKQARVARDHIATSERCDKCCSRMGNRLAILYMSVRMISFTHDALRADVLASLRCTHKMILATEL